MPLAQLSVLALGLGVVTGVGAVLFRDLIGLIHNLLFAGQAVVHYDANIFTAAAPWGPLVILVPVVGAVGVTFLVTNFAPEAKGHGVPEVMDAIYYKGGVIRPVVALVKSLASALCDRQRFVGRAGRTDHPDRLGTWLHTGSDHPHARWTADRARRCGRRRGHRIDFQYSDRRRHVRHRTDDARGKRRDVSSSRDCDGDSYLRGPLVLRRCARLPCTAASSHGCRFECAPRASPVRCAWRPHRLRGGRFHPRTASSRRNLRSDRVPLSTARAGHADCRCAHVPPLSYPGSVLRRWRRLRHRSGGVGRTDLCILATRVARRLQDVGDHDQSGVGLIWRHLFTVVVHGRDAWRRLRGAAERRRPADSCSASPPSPWSAWERWWAAAPAL